MLYIVRSDNREIEWHVGDYVPKYRNGNPFDDVVEVQADGHELEYLANKVMFPTYNKSVLSWKGLQAQAVYDQMIYFEKL